MSYTKAMRILHDAERALDSRFTVRLTLGGEGRKLELVRRGGLHTATKPRRQASPLRQTRASRQRLPALRGCPGWLRVVMAMARLRVWQVKRPRGVSCAVGRWSAHA